MNTESMDEELLEFAAGETEAAVSTAEPWKVLIADDEEEVHAVTRLALADFTLHDRPIRFLDAYTGREAVEVMQREADIALILMDVVMETDSAGLDAVQVIRNELGNKLVRIVLRTGQPGQAPEREVVRRYDINDYKEKTELTAKKLYTLMHTGLSLYRELVAMERNRQGLEHVIEASASIFEEKSMKRFQRGLLEQLAALLHAKRDAVIVSAPGFSVSTDEHGGLRVVAGTGCYSKLEGQMANEALAPEVLGRVRRVVARNLPEIGDHYFVVHFSSRSGHGHVVYLNSETRFKPADVLLIELFCRNAGIAFENLAMHEEVTDSQRRMIVLLSTAIEERSKDLRNHVQRVSEYSVLIGREIGLSAQDLDTLAIAAAMHDLGKVSVPDAILNKPGLYTPAERAIMETHVGHGENILAGQHGVLLKNAEIVVGQHHERWDGAGYPRGLEGHEIHLYGRIAAVADVFDALTTRRCYKEPWPVEEAVEYFRAQSGKQFDPVLVDAFLAQLPEILRIKEHWSDLERTSVAAAV